MFRSFRTKSFLVLFSLLIMSPLAKVSQAKDMDCTGSFDGKTLREVRDCAYQSTYLYFPDIVTCQRVRDNLQKLDLISKNEPATKCSDDIELRSSFYASFHASILKDKSLTGSQIVDLTTCQEVERSIATGMIYTKNGQEDAFNNDQRSEDIDIVSLTGYCKKANSGYQVKVNTSMKPQKGSLPLEYKDADSCLKAFNAVVDSGMSIPLDGCRTYFDLSFRGEFSISGSDVKGITPIPTDECEAAKILLTQTQSYGSITASCLPHDADSEILDLQLVEN